MPRHSADTAGLDASAISTRLNTLGRDCENGVTGWRAAQWPIPELRRTEAPLIAEVRQGQLCRRSGRGMEHPGSPGSRASREADHQFMDFTAACTSGVDISRRAAFLAAPSHDCGTIEVREYNKTNVITGSSLRNNSSNAGGIDARLFSLVGGAVPGSPSNQSRLHAHRKISRSWGGC